MGMPFTLRGKRWYASRYIDGKFCTRPDKLMVRLVDQDGIQIIEQGGPHMSLWAWMQEYGGCRTKEEAKMRLLAISPAQIILSDAIDTPVDFKHVPREFLNRSYERRLQIKDPLSLAMHRLFGETCAEHVLKTYMMGSETKRFRDKSGVMVSDTLTVYWYIDRNGKVCHDKLIRYKADGHRDHTFGGSRRMRTKDGYGFRCLFGEHLLPTRKYDEKVYIVEAEKSALYARAFFKQGIWLASGGLNNLRPGNIGDDWVLLPDLDAYEDWDKKFPGQCVKWWEFFPNYVPLPKDDIADYITYRLEKNGTDNKPI